MAEMGGQIDKMVSFINFEAKNKREEILAKAKQDKEAKKLETVHRERLKIEADFNKKIKNVETMEKMCATRPAPLCSWEVGGGGVRAARVVLWLRCMLPRSYGADSPVVSVGAIHTPRRVRV